MTENKPPAYTWYPRDFAADEPVQLMSLAEEGAYRRLLDHQWLHGSIPGDVESLARICKNTPVKEMRKIWAKIEPCFIRMEGQPPRYQNRRLERVRNERKSFINKQSENGKKGAEARWKGKHGDGGANGGAMPSPVATESPAFATASATAVEQPTSPKETGEARSEILPHNQRSVMGLVIEKLYFGKRPTPSEMASNADILGMLHKEGHSWDRLARAIEGLALRRDRGELKSVAKNQPVSLKWVWSQKQTLNQIALSEDALYRGPGPPQDEKRGGVTGLGEVVNIFTKRGA